MTVKMACTILHKKAVRLAYIVQKHCKASFYSRLSSSYGSSYMTVNRLIVIL